MHFVYCQISGKCILVCIFLVFCWLICQQSSVWIISPLWLLTARHHAHVLLLSRSLLLTVNPGEKEICCTMIHDTISNGEGKAWFFSSLQNNKGLELKNEISESRASNYRFTKQQESEIYGLAGSFGPSTLKITSLVAVPALAPADDVWEVHDSVVVTFSQVTNKACYQGCVDSPVPQSDIFKILQVYCACALLSLATFPLRCFIKVLTIFECRAGTRRFWWFENVVDPSDISRSENVFERRPSCNNIPFRTLVNSGTFRGSDREVSPDVNCFGHAMQIWDAEFAGHRCILPRLSDVLVLQFSDTEWFPDAVQFGNVTGTWSSEGAPLCTSCSVGAGMCKRVSSWTRLNLALATTAEISFLWICLYTTVPCTQGIVCMLLSAYRTCPIR